MTQYFGIDLRVAAVALILCCATSTVTAQASEEAMLNGLNGAVFVYRNMATSGARIDSIHDLELHINNGEVVSMIRSVKADRDDRGDRDGKVEITGRARIAGRRFTTTYPGYRSANYEIAENGETIALPSARYIFHRRK